MQTLGVKCVTGSQIITKNIITIFYFEYFFIAETIIIVMQQMKINPEQKIIFCFKTNFTGLHM